RVSKADRREQVRRAAVVETVSDFVDDLAARGVWTQVLARELRFDGLLADENVLFLAFFAEPLLDLVFGARRLDDRKPVERRTRRRLVDENLANVAVAHLVVERNDLPVHLRPDAMIADVGVHLISKIERRPAARHAVDVALRGKHEDLRIEEIELEVLHEHARIARVVLP